MSSKMWVQALQGIPRLQKEEWLRLDGFTRWLISVRAAVLIMTFISAALAGIVAWRDGAFIWWRWVLVAIGLVLAHATNNILNDITDHKKGVDEENYFRTQYGVQPIESGLMTERQAIWMAALTGLMALVAGLPLVLTSGTLGWVMLGLGAIFVLFYTWPLKYIGLGEIAVILVWGPLMVGGGYYVIAGQWSWDAVLISLPYALGTTMVIFGKHIDKLAADKGKGIRTLPVLLGEKAARYTTLAMMGLQYALVLFMVIRGTFSIVLLVVFFAVRLIPDVWKLYKAPKPDTLPDGYRADVWPLYFVAMAFVHNRRFGLLYLAGILVDTLLRVTNVLG